MRLDGDGSRNARALAETVGPLFRTLAQTSNHPAIHAPTRPPTHVPTYARMHARAHLTSHHIRSDHITSHHITHACRCLPMLKPRCAIGSGNAALKPCLTVFPGVSTTKGHYVSNDLGLDTSPDLSGQTCSTNLPSACKSVPLKRVSLEVTSTDPFSWQPGRRRPKGGPSIF